MECLEEEVADVLIYLVRLCDVAGIDLIDAANTKVDRNTSRFPARPQRSAG
jgi:NTP pyrophosphatase (non-canonical NTP hydrolase)